MSSFTKLKIRYTELCAALVLTFHFVNGVISINGISVATIALVFGLQVLDGLKGNFHLKRSTLLIIGFVLLGFLLSLIKLLVDSNTVSYLFYFLAFGLISLHVGSGDVQVKKVIHYIVMIGAFGLVIHSLRGFSGLNSSVTMGISYSILPVLLAAIVEFACERKILSLSTVCIVLSTYVLISIAPRGCWVVILLFVFFLFLFRIINAKTESKQKVMKILLIALLLSVVVVVIYNIYDVVVWLNTFLANTFGITISALNKIIYYYNKGDLMNGRNDLWEAAMVYITKSPLFGNGIGYFESLHEGTHLHNLMLQAMCEGGLIYLGVIVWTLVKAVKVVLTSSLFVDLRSYGFSLMVISSGLVLLFFSSAYWLWVPFWYCVGWLFAHGKEKKIKRRAR